MSKLYRRVIKETIESIKNHPEEWGINLTGYRLSHRDSGRSVWIANERYGLSIAQNGSEFGGVGGYGYGAFWHSPWRYRLWNVVQGWKALKHAKDFEILMVAHGGAHNDTIATVEVRNN